MNFLYSIYLACLFSGCYFLVKLFFKYWSRATVWELVIWQSFKDIFSLAFLCYLIFFIINYWFLLDNFSGRMITYSLVSSLMAVSIKVLISSWVVSSTQIKIFVISRFFILAGSISIRPLKKSLTYSLIRTVLM